MESQSKIARRIYITQGANAAREYLGYPPIAPEGRLIREGGASNEQVKSRKSKPIFTKREWTRLKYTLIGSLFMFGMVVIPEGVMRGESWLSIITGWICISFGLTAFLAFIVYASNKTFEVSEDE